MPFATFCRVREVSSEDSVQLAENLIKSQPGKKWKTKSAGEKSAYVILEMSESQKITGIDIGNEHSAFIEVLVGKSSCDPKDFTEILITSSFMTPPESKNSTNSNRVRCFNQEALVPMAVENKWSLVKIVCTQPFNKHVSYGLSFIKVHVYQNELAKPTNVNKNLVPAEFLKISTSSKSTDVAKLSASSTGKLKFREDSPDSESENSASLFNRWKNTKDKESVQTTATAIRLASKNPIMQRRPSDVILKAQTSRPTGNEGLILDRNRNNLLFGDDKDEDDHDNKANQAKKERLTKQIEVDKEIRRLELQNQSDKTKRKLVSAPQSIESKKVKQIVPTDYDPDKTNETSNARTEADYKSKKRLSSPTVRPNKKVKTADTTKYRPFNQLLNGVVLVISGIQNPDRGDLRNKALALGAKYKSDWDNSCTHLICAFKNTPKYNQVSGKGKIVTRSWIEKCYSLKKYLPWRRYALDSKELAKPESDDEILDAILQAENIKNSNDKDLPSSSGTIRESVGCINNLTLYDDQPISNNLIDINPEPSSDTDTDDEIQRIEEKNQIKESKPTPTKEEDIYEASTDEEDYLQEKLNQVNSLNFFKLLTFFISDDVGSVDKIKLEQLIGQYAGCITNKLSEAQYAISTRGLSNYGTLFSGEIVRPIWIYECNDLRTKLPTSRYLI